MRLVPAITLVGCAASARPVADPATRTVACEAYQAGGAPPGAR